MNVPKGTNTTPTQLHFRSHLTSSVIAEIEQDLLDFVEMWRQKGFEVNRFTLLRKVKELKPDLLERSEGAAKICLSRFLAKNQLMHRVATTARPS